MHFLLPSTHKADAGLVFLKRTSSNSSGSAATSNSSHNLCNTTSPDKINLTQNVLRRATIAKETSIMKPKRIDSKKPAILTKNDSVGAKDIDACFVCAWVFPHSFRGEEKNTHMDRCMEGRGDEDKKFWNKCQGDLKEYLYRFDEAAMGSVTQQRKNFKLKEAANGKRRESQSTTSQQRRRRKIKKKIIKVVKEETEVVEVVKAGRTKMNDLKFEPLIKKKLKVETIEEKKELNGEVKQSHTKILLLPLVMDLVFDPSKEFSKGSRRQKEAKESKELKQ